MKRCEVCGDTLDDAEFCIIPDCPYKERAATGRLDPASGATRAPQAPLPAGPVGLDPASFARPLRRLVASGPEFVIALAIEIFGTLLGPLGPVISLTLALYFLLRDQDDSRLSIGKRLTNLRVVDGETGALATARQAALRNLPWALGFLLAVVPGVEIMGWGLILVGGTIEALLMLLDPAGRRLGDHLAGTRVVGVEQR